MIAATLACSRLLVLVVGLPLAAVTVTQDALPRLPPVHTLHADSSASLAQSSPRSAAIQMAQAAPTPLPMNQQSSPEPAQAPVPAFDAGEKRLAFDVISIKRHTAASGPAQRPTMTPNGFSSMGLPMFAIFQMAYVPANQSGVLRGDLIKGAPHWLSEETYDIVARVNESDLADWQKPEMKQTMLRAMLQAMLAERCKVVVHHESKEVPVYDLVVAKGGAKFKQAETVDVDQLRQKPGGGGMMSGTSVRAVPSTNGIQYYGISMGILAQTILPSMAGRPVVDKTGLTGYYDLTLPDPKRPSMASSPPSLRESQPLDAPSPAPEDDESIFTVLPEVLGLRLRPSRGQVDTLVIDHVERPTEN